MKHLPGVAGQLLGTAKCTVASRTAMRSSMSAGHISTRSRAATRMEWRRGWHQEPGPRETRAGSSRATALRAATRIDWDGLLHGTDS